MFTPVWIDGAEHAVGGIQLDDGQSIVTQQFGGTAIDNVTSNVASGARAYGFNTVASSCWGYKSDLSASSLWEGCFKVRRAASPSTSRAIFQVASASDLGNARFGITSTGEIFADIYRDPSVRATQTGPALPTDIWVLVEWALDFSTTSWIVYWQVAGTPQTNVTWTAPDSRTPSGVSFGAIGVVATGEHYMDDMVAENGSISEHPIGDKQVLSYLPNRVGTHNLEATPSNSFFKDIATTETALTSAETTSYQQLDNRLPSLTSADHVLSDPDAALTSSHYLEYGFEPTDANPEAVRAYVTLSQDSAVADTIVARLREGGSDGDIRNGAINSTALLHYSAMFAEKPSGGAWTQSAFNAAMLRYGFSTDVDGRVRLYGAVLEALFDASVVVDTSFESADLATEFEAWSTGEEPTFVTSPVYDGTYAYASVAPGQPDGHWARFDRLPINTRVVVGRFYFRINNWPGGEENAIFTITDGPQVDTLAFMVADVAGQKQIQPTFNGFDLTAQNISLNTWYRIEFKLDTSATNWKLTWGIATGEGPLSTVDTDATGGNTKPAEDLYWIQLGVNTWSASVAFYADAIKLTNVAGDYPLGGISVGFKRLYGPALLSGSPVDLYTVPSGRRASLLHIHASNPSGSPVDLNLSIGSDAAATRIYDDFPLGADSVEDDFTDYVLGAGEKIQGWASDAATVNLTISGLDESA